MDNNLGVKCVVLSKTENPQRLCAIAMHGDYSEKFVPEEDEWMNLSEKEAGRRIVKNCLKFEHWGVIEHPSITFAMKGVPHSVMQQVRTHRIATFDVQSMRYTGQRFLDWKNFVDTKLNKDKYHIESLTLLEELVYIRPVGRYQDRFSHSIDFNSHIRDLMLQYVADHLYRVIGMLFHGDEKAPFEMFRSFITADYRQNMTMTFNLKSILHVIKLRSKKDAQLECRVFINLIYQELKDWVPDVIEFLEDPKNSRVVNSI